MVGDGTRSYFLGVGGAKVWCSVSDHRMKKQLHVPVCLSSPSPSMLHGRYGSFLSAAEGGCSVPGLSMAPAADHRHRGGGSGRHVRGRHAQRSRPPEHYSPPSSPQAPCQQGSLSLRGPPGTLVTPTTQAADANSGRKPRGGGAYLAGTAVLYPPDPASTPREAGSCSHLPW